MKILFIQDNGINESLALTELSSYLKAHGHRTGLLLEKEEKNLFRKIQEFSPDLFLIPCSILAQSWAIGMATRLKQRFDKPVVFAGTYPTFRPEIIEIDPVDVICVGEAEEAILELCETMQGGGDITGIRNLWVKSGGKVFKNPLRPLMEDLDEIPLPDRELYYGYRFIRDFEWKKFMSGRGCYHHCAYCYQPAFRKMYGNKGKYVRRKSPRRVVDEICHIHERYPIRIAHFSDDLFITDLDWLEAFAEQKNRRLDLPFSCNTSVEFVSERSVSLLKEAGCRFVAIGIETGVEEQRRMILNKRISNEDIIHAAGVIKKAGIILVTFNMLAGPGETVAQAFETMRLNADIGADLARATICIPIPGTRIARYGIDHGFLDKDFENDVDDFRGSDEGALRPGFLTKETREFENLYSLFQLGVMVPRLMPVLRMIVKLPPNPLFKAIGLIRIYLEKKVSALNLINGLRYYRHVGDPANRTTNFVPLV